MKEIIQWLCEGVISDRHWESGCYLGRANCCRPGRRPAAGSQTWGRVHTALWSNNEIQHKKHSLFLNWSTNMNLEKSDVSPHTGRRAWTKSFRTFQTKDESPRTHQATVDVHHARLRRSAMDGCREQEHRISSQYCRQRAEFTSRGQCHLVLLQV